MAGDPILFDTSLLVAASVEQHPGHDAARAYIAAQRAAGAASVITPQVCREFLVVLTRQPVSSRVFTSKEALEALDEWRRACTLLHENAATLAECLAWSTDTTSRASRSTTATSSP